MKEALMSAYFEKGADLTLTKNLVDIAVELGLDYKSVELFLKTDELAAEVKLEEQLNFKRGISGVPFYIINNKYGVSGAQPVEAFLQVFTEVGSEAPLNAEACDVETKNC
jgi:predicted DsbA family dithiol-disulfide isomerase